MRWHVERKEEAGPWAFSPDNPLESSFVWGEPGRVFVAEPRPEDFLEGRQADAAALLAAVARHFARRSPRARLFGALPFDLEEPVWMFCTEHWRELSSWPGSPHPWSRASLSDSASNEALSERESFESSVELALQAIGRGELRKVVLARALEVAWDSRRLAALLDRLRVLNPTGTVFSMCHTSAGEQRRLIGVTPELLVQRRGDQVLSAPLAGTSARSAEREADEARAETLLGSRKDRFEHEIVVTSLRQRLAAFAELDPYAGPHLVATERLWHLRSAVSGHLKSQHNALQLALALHPTPAVAGDPAGSALEFVRKHEKRRRGFYAGAIGTMDSAGDGSFMVAIRCADVGRSGARLFAGAGIVEGSRPQLEFAETQAKMGTMLEALGGR